MRVRVWVHGAEGPAHDFELVDAPRVGDRVSVMLGNETEDGVVASVSWQLQAIEPPANDLAITAEPVGTVAIVHVICRPATRLDDAAVMVEGVDRPEHTLGVSSA